MRHLMDNIDFMKTIKKMTINVALLCYASAFAQSSKKITCEAEVTFKYRQTCDTNGRICGVDLPNKTWSTLFTFSQSVSEIKKYDLGPLILDRFENDPEIGIDLTKNAKMALDALKPLLEVKTQGRQELTAWSSIRYDPTHIKDNWSKNTTYLLTGGGAYVGGILSADHASDSAWTSVSFQTLRLTPEYAGSITVKTSCLLTI